MLSPNKKGNKFTEAFEHPQSKEKRKETNWFIKGTSQAICLPGHTHAHIQKYSYPAKDVPSRRSHRM